MAKRAAKKGGTAVAEAPQAARVAGTVGLGDVLGQDRAVGVLRGAAASGRLHHAWIFHGPEGVGKFTTAMAFAGLVLDPTSAPDLAGELAPDPESEVQRMLRAGSHPDLHVITKELARFSDDASVRGQKLITIPKRVVEDHLLRPASLAPSLRLGGMASKVFIVDEAELLDPSPTRAPVQNALLKTLEEPAPGTLIILVTSSEERLLPTVRSRCQRVSFRALPEAAMEAWIDRAGLEFGEAERAWLVRYSAGSPGRMLRAMEGGLYRWHQRLEPMLEAADAGRFSPELGPLIAELVDAWAQEHVKRGEKAGENRSKEAANKEGARLMFSLLAERYRERLARGRGVEAALLAIDLIREAETDLASNVAMAFVAERLASGFSERSG